MGVRTFRQAGLAVVPMLLLAQCAPQCAPAAPSPASVAYRDVTASVPPDMVTAEITSDGRFIGYAGLGAGTWRLDAETGQTAETEGGLLIGDGWGVVDFASDTSVGLYDIASGALVARAEVLAGWTLLSIDSVSRDGHRVGVTVATPTYVTGLLLDLRTGGAVRVDSRIPGSGAIGPAAYDVLVSADGSAVVFSYRDGPEGCVACVDAWTARSGDVHPGGIIGNTELVSPTVAGGRSSTGDSEPVDVSSDGRYVLFHSSASDLAGGNGAPPSRGQLHVRDTVARTTSPVPVTSALGDPFAAAVSDDGTKIALPTDRATVVGPRPFAAILDRTTGLTTVLTPTDPDHQLWGRSYLALSPSGRRLAFDVTTADGRVQHAIVDITY